MPNAGNWDTSNGVGGGCKASNTSYWMPGYYRVFQEVTGDPYWGKAADDVVDLYNLAADPSTGIIVNEVDQNGVGVKGQSYDYNSCRIPWRAVLDYLWYGTAGAAAETTKITNWANSVGIMNVVDGYNANGTATGKYKGLNEWVGGFTLGAMSDSQSMVDTFANYFVGISNDNGTYYGAAANALSAPAEWQRVEPAGNAGHGRRRKRKRRGIDGHVGRRGRRQRWGHDGRGQRRRRAERSDAERPCVELQWLRLQARPQPVRRGGRGRAHFDADALDASASPRLRGVSACPPDLGRWAGGLSLVDGAGLHAVENGDLVRAEVTAVHGQEPARAGYLGGARPISAHPNTALLRLGVQHLEHSL
jgi:hypothetical protein